MELFAYICFPLLLKKKHTHVSINIILTIQECFIETIMEFYA
jgi:hypothetical protein